MGKEFCLNFDQRIAIRERDNNQCQGCRIWPHCERDTPATTNLEVHHLLPRAYASRVGINPNFPENLITICQTMHTGHRDSIHPDSFQAKMTFRENPKVFLELGIEVREKLDNRQIYWNDNYTRPLAVRAVKNTQKVVSEGGSLADRLKNFFRSNG